MLSSDPLPASSPSSGAAEFPAAPGGLTLTRDLGRCAVGDRFLALQDGQQTSHVAYALSPVSSRTDRARIEAMFDSLRSLSHPHLQSLQRLEFVPGPEGLTPWLVTPFAGDADGLRSLSRLLRQRGGQMSPLEAEQAVGQILSALAYAHDPLRDAGPGPRSPVHHGPLSMDEILVDRHGRCVVEMYGVGRRVRGMVNAHPETARDEVLRVCEIAYQLITGLRAEEPLIPATRLVPKLSKAWSQWLSEGLDPSGGFGSAREALDRLPSSLERQVVSVPRRSRRVQSV